MARPFRHTFILVLVGLGTCMAAFGGWRFARASAPVNGPIVLISIDGLRADRLPAYGSTAIRTPAIDALAADGIVFEQAYSNIPQTLPAHAALLTGKLPFDTGVRDGIGFTIKGSERLLAEMLRDRGFSTAGIVSSYLLRKETGISQGFTFFDGDLPAADGSATGGLHRDGAASEQIAERWLDSVGTDRAFLFLHLDEPRAAIDGASPATTGEDVQRSYDASVAEADRIVGRLVRYLRAHQLYDRSTIVLLSDHGQGLGDHGEQAHGLFVYDEVLRVPLIVKQPAGEEAGRRVTALAQLVDIVPTVLDLAKAPDPGGLRGRSLKELIGGGNDGSTPRFVYAESMFGAYHFGWSELRSVTDGRFRFIAAPRAELYDLRLDPGQHDNLAEARPETVAALTKALKEFDRGGSGSALAAAAPVESEVRQQLEQLGYVGVRGDDVSSRADAGEPIDAKDKFQLVDQYRAAVAAAALPVFSAGLEQFRVLAHAEPGSADLWLHLAAAATRAERHELAVDAFARALELSPGSSSTALGLASASLRLRKLDDARQQAERVVGDAQAGKTALAEAHEVLARVALARRDDEGARAEARLAEESDPGRPVRAYVDGRIAHEQGHYTAATEAFGTALAATAKVGAPKLADLQYYAADTLLRLNRVSEAEYLFLEALKAAPFSARSRAGLAAVYRATGRTDEAAATLAAH